MTLHEVTNSVFNLAVAGYINGEKFTADRLFKMINNSFKGSLKLGNKVAIEIALPDGWWLCTINRYSDKADGFDYSIPATREEEQKIWNALTA